MDIKKTTVKKIPVFRDDRGELFVCETGKEIPFDIKRMFFISNVPTGAKRGEHAYKYDEFIVCCSGGCSVSIKTDDTVRSFRLSAEESILIPGGLWRVFSDFSADCVLAVACNMPYSKDDYLTDGD